MCNMFKNRKLVISFVLSLIFLILFLLFFKMVDISTSDKEFNHEEQILVDSSYIQYDSLFKSIDFNLDRIIKEKNSKNLTSVEIQKIKQTIKISKPSNEPNWVKNYNFTDKGEVTFYLVTKPGFIANKWGAVQYYLPGDDNKYYYEITLKTGFYYFQTISHPRDSVSFVVDNNGVYKLGYQELHPNFIIFKDSL